MSNLKVVRAVLSSLLWAGSRVGPYKKPCEWLLHYISGSGREKPIPAYVMSKSIKDILYALNIQEDNVVQGRDYTLHFNNSTLYSGGGFENRPDLFYLIGGFTATVRVEEGRVFVKLQDVYDWHPVIKEQYFYREEERLIEWEEQVKDLHYRCELLEWELDGRYGPPPEANWVGKGAWVKTKVRKVIKLEQWFCSSLSLPGWAHKCLNKFLGDEYYPLEGFPMGNPGFSNKLWYRLMEVGAKPFTSSFEGYIDI